MTSIAAEVKALEDKVTALQAKAHTLDKVQALLAGPVQLPLEQYDLRSKLVEEVHHALDRAGAPREAGGWLTRIEALGEMVAKHVSTGDGPVSAGVHTLQEAKDEGWREHVEALHRALGFNAPPSAKSGILRAEQFIDALKEETDNLRRLLKESQAEVRRLVNHGAEREEVIKERGARLEDIEAALDAEGWSAPGGAVERIRRFADDWRGLIKSTGDYERMVEDLADVLASPLTQFADAERIENRVDETTDVLAAAKQLAEAASFLLEDHLCMQETKRPALSAKDMAVLDEMLTADPSPWDLSAANRAVLKRVREYVAGPIEVSTPKVNTITTETRTDFTSPDIDANPDVDAAQRIAEEQAKPKETVIGCKHIEVSSVHRGGQLAERVCRGCGALMTMAFVVTRMNTKPKRQRMFLLATAQPPGWIEEHETCTRFDTEEAAEKAKPRGSKVVPLADVPALLVKDAAPKKAKEPPAPPPDAFASTGYVITKVRDGTPRMYVMADADPAHPHSIWTVAKAGARIFEKYVDAADEKKRLKLKLGEPIPTEMIEDKYGVMKEPPATTPEEWSEKRRGYLDEAEAAGTIFGNETTELAARRAEDGGTP